MKKLVKLWLVYALTFPFVFIYKVIGRSESWHELAYYQRTVPLSFLFRDRAFIFKRFRMLDIQFGYLGPMAVGVLGNREYDSLDVFDRDVIDIGASIGDTAILFALRGAKKVFGYEINEKNYLLAVRNIKINGLEDVVDVRFAGISNNKINSNDPLLLAIMSKENAETVDSAQHIALSDVLREARAGFVLKCDVDGYEYSIFDESPDLLRLASAIFIEYHFGTQRLETELVSKGFDVMNFKVGERHVDFHPAQYRDMEIGYLVATK